MSDKTTSPKWCQATLNVNARSTRNPAGPPSEELALSLAVVPGYYRVGSPIWVTGEIRNVSNRMLSGRQWPVTTSAFNFTITPPNGGARVARTESADSLPSAVVELGGPFAIPPGSSKFFAIRLDKLYDLSAPGPYFVHLDASDVSLETSITRPGVGLHVVPLSSNTITINVLPPRQPGPGSPRPNSVYEDAPTANSAGKAIGGFALSLPAYPSVADLGAPIDLTVELRNVTKVPHDVTFGSRSHAYDFLIVSDRTHDVVHRTGGGEVGYDLSPLESRATKLYPDTALFGRFELTKLYNFTAAGSYTIRVRYGRPTIDGKAVALESNPMHITLRYVPHTTTLTGGTPGHVFTIRLESQRPVYVSGQPIRLRVTITNDTQFVYGLASDPPWWLTRLRITDLSGSPVPGGDRGGARLDLRMGRYFPGTSTVLAFQDPANMWSDGTQWADARRWIYDTLAPGMYSLTAAGTELTQFNHSTITRFESSSDRSNSVLIQVISLASAKAISPQRLQDAKTDSELHDLAAQYAVLRARFIAIMGKVDDKTGVADRAQYGFYDWADAARALELKIDRLPGAGDPTSPYVNVIANLWEAQYHLLHELADITQACGRERATATLAVSDYFIRTVNDELARHQAGVADAAEPPLEATPPPACR